MTYKGKPLEKGTIQFIPENGRPASGAITNGHFVLTTNVEGDGAAPGIHGVGVTAYEEVPAKKPGQEPTTKSQLPAKYALPADSDIKVEIPASGKKDIQIDLK